MLKYTLIVYAKLIPFIVLFIYTVLEMSQYQRINKIITIFLISLLLVRRIFK